jgi:lipoprotein signal peptidase
MILVTKKTKTLWWSFVFLLLVLIDQLVKCLVRDIFKNDLFAFSLPLPSWMMFAVYAIILFFIIRYCIKSYKIFSSYQWFAWTLILAGAALNIGERIILGYVRDFIFITTGVFNLADGYIIAGVVILLFFGLLKNNANYAK